MSSKWKSRKLWVAVLAMLVPAALLAGSTYVLVTAPEKAGALTAVAGAVSAILTAAVGAVYVVTEGKIDLRALPAAIDPLLHSIVDLAEKNAAVYAALVRAAGEALPEEPDVLPPKAEDTQDT